MLDVIVPANKSPVEKLRGKPLEGDRTCDTRRGFRIFSTLLHPDDDGDFMPDDDDEYCQNLPDSTAEDAPDSESAPA